MTEKMKKRIVEWYHRRWISKKKHKLAYFALAGIIIMSIYVASVVTGIYPSESENKVPMVMQIWWDQLQQILI